MGRRAGGVAAHAAALLVAVLSLTACDPLVRPGPPESTAPSGTTTEPAGTDSSTGDVTPAVAGEETEIDVSETGVVSAAGIARAIAEARTLLEADPGAKVTIRFPPGLHDLSGVFPQGTPRLLELQDTGVIDVSGIAPSGGGSLTFAGDGKETTTLVFDKNVRQIHGHRSAHITFRGLHLTTRQALTTQGRVTDVGKRQVTLRIDEGFPTPGDLVVPEMPGTRLLRRCEGSGQDPRLAERDSERVKWNTADRVSGRDWLIRTRPGDLPFREGDVVAVGAQTMGQSYFFTESQDITFAHVRWSQLSRGVFRQGSRDAHIADSSIVRPPAIGGRVPCLATSDSGPQFGHPDDPPTSGNTVERFRATGTAQNTLTFFHSSGRLEDVTIRDSFDKGVFLRDSAGVTQEKVDLQHAPLLMN